MWDGDPDRFERLYHLHREAIRRLAHVYAADAADVDDLAQEVWFAVWRALPNFRGDCSERTFVYRIAHNRGLTHRARGRRLPSGPVDAVPQLADPRAGPDLLAERSARAERLLEAVRALPDSWKQVVVLHLEGLGNQEIATVTGLTETNVAVRLSRARARLRDVLLVLAEDR